jgi:hypothetical protein
MVCGSTCLDTQNDLTHCGGCGTRCPSGSLSCTGGMCVCPSNQVVCNNACVDTSNDETHCGNCQTSCGTGQVCSVGQCQQYRDFGLPAPSQVKCLTADAQNLYWGQTSSTTGDSLVVKMPVGGGSMTTLATDPYGGNYSEISHLIVDGTSAYWVDNNSIRTVHLDGTGLQTLASMPGSVITGLAQDSQSLYWTVGSSSIIFGPATTVDGSVQSIPKTGAPSPKVLAANEADPVAIAVANGVVYWLDQGTFQAQKYQNDGALLSLPSSGAGTAQVLAALTTPGVLVVTSAGVYVGVNTPTQGLYGLNPILMLVPLAGGNPTPIITELLTGEFYGLTADAKNLYFVVDTPGGRAPLLQLPIGGTSTTTLVGSASAVFQLEGSVAYQGGNGDIWSVTF